MKSFWPLSQAEHCLAKSSVIVKKHASKKWKHVSSVYSAEK
ncbi:hypothetical protein AT236_01211 [Lactobacillus delbrueckii subsp. bulgaricus]|nr:hypothetical protein AT236_01211 [Lactobacillus delbrueckii subsp. bulgaricus]EHE89861.1 hypothetical protein LDBUL1519_00807 [Lactobacillus delbrueckii subsp. bulgaricus CNCM I-1519]